MSLEVLTAYAVEIKHVSHTSTYANSCKAHHYYFVVWFLSCCSCYSDDHCHHVILERWQSKTTSIFKSKVVVIIKVVSHVTIAASIHTSSAHAAIVVKAVAHATFRTIIVHLQVIVATHALIFAVIGDTTLLEFTATT